MKFQAKRCVPIQTLQISTVVIQHLHMLQGRSHFSRSPVTGRPLYEFVFTKRIYEGYELSSENCTSKSHLSLCFFLPSWAV